MKSITRDLVSRRIGAICVLIAMLGGGAAAHTVNLTEKDWAKLETFEAHSLSRADTFHAQQKWREAVADYDSFIAEFPASYAIPYALLKKGFSLEADDKRFKAIEAYTEVLDYFPDNIAFAAPALFFIGNCHHSNGEMEKALLRWSEMADDEDYSQHPLAAYAINSLADNLMKLGRVADAVRYYTQVAVDFKSKNRAARIAAMPHVITFHIRTQRSEPELQKFYRNVSTFHHDPHVVPKDLSNDRTYWSQILSAVESRSGFSAEDRAKGKHKTYLEYWTKLLDGKWMDDDDFQKHIIDLWYNAREDRVAWHQRLNRQFDQYQKPGDFDRITKWIIWNLGFKEEVERYYAKYNFEKMSNAQIIQVIFVFYSHDVELARNLIGKLKFDLMSDGEIAAFARSLWGKDDSMVERVCSNIRDLDYGRMEVLYFFHRRHAYLTDNQHKRAIPLAIEMTMVDKYAKEAWFLKAQIHQFRGQWEEAIASYEQTDDPIRTVWLIVDCFMAWQKPKRAINQLSEIENFFQKHSDWGPRAALAIAHVYGGMGQRKAQVSGLRRVLKQYPHSGQSSAAHVELESMGESIKDKGEDEQIVQTGGGVDAQ
ncbi:MAG: tetratricopeptide repeat protein [Verrucomicrobia bacterium]|nr:tetratricopeptide repeat protein [Verrucomicrobiota bacterium]MDA1086143.1 tetratricopeptide repeat protein [Verrucomicrobiota bacterium]